MGLDSEMTILNDYFLFVKSYKFGVSDSILSMVNGSLDRKILISQKSTPNFKLNDSGSSVEFIGDEVEAHTKSPMWVYDSPFPSNFLIRFHIHSGMKFSSPQMRFPGFSSDPVIDHGVLVNHWIAQESFSLNEFMKVFCGENVISVGYLIDIFFYRKEGTDHQHHFLPLYVKTGQAQDVTPEEFDDTMGEVYRTILVRSVHEE